MHSSRRTSAPRESLLGWALPSPNFSACRCEAPSWSAATRRRFWSPRLVAANQLLTSRRLKEWERAPALQTLQSFPHKLLGREGGGKPQEGRIRGRVAPPFLIPGEKSGLESQLGCNCTKSCTAPMVPPSWPIASIPAGSVFYIPHTLTPNSSWWTDCLLK